MENYLYPIRNPLDAIILSDIRNQCSSYMTNYTSSINPIQQLIWYFKFYKKEYGDGNMACFLLKSNGNNFGFALYRITNGKYWITGGVKANERGKGLGKILFSELLKKIPSKEIWLEVLYDNEAAKKIYVGLGFKEEKDVEIKGKRVVVMSLQNNDIMTPSPI
jgi:ribosomal protein S18 acetylase RimI-like enzyme